MQVRIIKSTEALQKLNTKRLMALKKIVRKDFMGADQGFFIGNTADELDDYINRINSVLNTREHIG